MSNYKNFTDRDTYIVARAAWRADYAELSQQIRDAKNAMKEAQRAGGGGREQYTREYLRNKARNMMEIRADMTAQSAAQRAARLDEKAAA